MVEIATSGEEGLRKAESSRPDLVVLDLMLPNLDGLEVCRRIRSNNGLAGTAIVMMTAKGEEEILSPALSTVQTTMLPNRSVRRSWLRASGRFCAEEQLAGEAGQMNRLWCKI